MAAVIAVKRLWDSKPAPPPGDPIWLDGTAASTCNAAGSGTSLVFGCRLGYIDARMGWSSTLVPGQLSSLFLLGLCCRRRRAIPIAALVPPKCCRERV